MDRTTRISRLPISVTLLASVFPAAAPASASARISFDWFNDVLNDRQHRRLFITGTPDDSQVAVVNYEGRLLKVIDGLQGPLKLTMVEGLLYVSQHRTGAIAVIDPLPFASRTRSTSPRTRAPTSWEVRGATYG